MNWRRRFLYALIVALVALPVIIVPLSLHAGNRKSEAERQKGEAEHQEKVANSHAALAAHVKSYMRSDPDPSFRQAAGAVNSQETDQTSDALGKAVTVKPLATFKGHRNFVWSAKFNPDGKSIVTASDDKTARVWDAVSTGKGNGNGAG